MKSPLLSLFFFLIAGTAAHAQPINWFVDAGWGVNQASVLQSSPFHDETTALSRNIGFGIWRNLHHAGVWSWQVGIYQSLAAVRLRHNITFGPFAESRHFSVYHSKVGMLSFPLSLQYKRQLRGSHVLLAQGGAALGWNPMPEKQGVLTSSYSNYQGMWESEITNEVVPFRIPFVLAGLGYGVEITPTWHLQVLLKARIPITQQTIQTGESHVTEVVKGEVSQEATAAYATRGGWLGLSFNLVHQKPFQGPQNTN